MSQELNQIIGRRIHLARTRAGLTQAKLAERIERTEASISNLERGVTLPTLTKLHEIALHTGMPLTFFVEGMGEQLPDPYRQRLIDQIVDVCGALNEQQLKIAAAQLAALRG